jgi:hypothetical protein
VTTWLLIFLGLSLIATAAGWAMGSRRKEARGKMSQFAAAGFLAFGVGWFIVARLARDYADTDGYGADAAGWFGLSGKWMVLLSAMLAGHGWVMGARQLPARGVVRFAYFIAVFGIVALAADRTLPVYVLLGDGRRDSEGFLRQSETIEATCGAVALLNYLERYRHHPPLTEREVSRVCGVTFEGTTTAALVRAARTFGLTNAAACLLDLPKLERTRLPVIVSISTLPGVHHATLLVRLDADRAEFIDPAYGKWSVTRKRFQEIWYGRTVVME